ncbi:hypothetical protein [Sphaerisporangium flaviroseum]
MIAWLEHAPRCRRIAQMWLTAAQVLERAGDTAPSVYAYHKALSCLEL